MKAKDIIEKLKLEPLEIEGGFFKSTYISSISLSKKTLNDKYNSRRSLFSSIYYLLTPENFSALHRLPGIEMFHHYLGDPVKMLNLPSEGSGQIVFLGKDILNGQKVQHMVEAYNWQGCRLEDGGEFALMGTTMSPGFNIDDFELADREAMLKKYPDFSADIILLTKENKSI